MTSTSKKSPSMTTAPVTLLRTRDSGRRRPNLSRGKLRSPSALGVEALGLGKRYGDQWALRDLDLAVPAGSVLGLLGHNGAGKTTTVRLLTTLAAPSEGAAQEATVDGLLSGRDNLEMVGRLHHLPRAEVRARASELLELFGLGDVAGRLAKTYSGGMRRRLDLAATLVARPAVLFLDEPTTGLDPASRRDLWNLLRSLTKDGATLVLTTQYLEEADALAEQIVVLDHGRVAAAGTPRELKYASAASASPSGWPVLPSSTRQRARWRHLSTATPTANSKPLTVSAPIRTGTGLIDVVRALDDAGVDAIDVARREATLDDVFLTLTRPRMEEVAAA
jgi:ABC-2 type transport system ATP-binding protein